MVFRMTPKTTKFGKLSFNVVGECDLCGTDVPDMYFPRVNILCVPCSTRLLDALGENIDLDVVKWKAEQKRREID